MLLGDSKPWITSLGPLRWFLVVPYTQQIRARDKNVVLINTGDTVQGSAEVMFTRGQAIVDVLNRFDIDAFCPGNWDYVYGSQRFVELFAGTTPKARWNAVAANLYYVSTDGDPQTPFATLAGKRVLPPYVIKHVGNLKVGILGLTSDRGPQVVGRTVSKGLVFSRGEAELAEFIPILRAVEKVDVLIVASELGLANNVRLADQFAGIDVILSSDMHEETPQPVIARTGTLIIEEGQDGTLLGELQLEIANGKVERWRWTAHTIDDTVKEDIDIARAVKAARERFVTGPGFTQSVNPFNGARLTRPIDTVVGHTRQALYRGNASDRDMPAVVEGSSHSFITDAFRVIAKANVAATRGFRYGTFIAPGPITLECLYHLIPIGPQAGVVRIQGRWLKRQLENAAEGSLDPNPAHWSGGWMFAYSGLTFDLDPYRATGFRVSNIRVDGKPLDPEGVYSYAGYWYADDPEDINGCDCPKLPGTFIRVVRGENGEILDGTDIVAQYLASLPDRTVEQISARVRLLKNLPAAVFGFPELQPLRGARPNRRERRQ